MEFEIALFVFAILAMTIGIVYYRITHRCWNELLQQYMPCASLKHSIQLIWNKDENTAFVAERMVQRYGRVFRSLFFNIVQVAELNAVKKILLHPDKFPRMSSQSGFNKHVLLDRFMGQNVVTTDGSIWKKHRVILNSAFINSSIFVNVFVEKSHYCIKQMIANGKQDGEEVGVDVKDYMTKFTLDVLGKAVFGVEFGYLDGKNSELLEAYQFVFVKGTGNPLFFLFPWLTKLPTAFNKKLFECLDIMDREIYRLMNQKRQAIQEIIKELEETKEEVNYNSIFSKMQSKSLLDGMVLENMLHNSTEEEYTAMTDKELRDNTVALFVAGHETTASALTFALHAIASHPTIQDSIQKELPHSLSSAQDFEQLQYLNCVIKESMRYYPVVHSIPSRIAAKEEELNGYQIPQGTMLMCNTYSLHFSTELWDTPYNFLPDRFLEEKSIKAGSWLPFGLGSHLCLGKGFSLLEQAVFLALLLKEYTVSVREEMKICKEFLFAPKPYTLYLKKK